jgi:type IV pilus assembly protein PilX
MKDRSAMKSFYGSPHFPLKQRGVILIVSLVVLVAMMLAAAGLIRSTDTSNVIAGNISFQQGTLNASDAGVAAAVAQLQAAGAAGLASDNPNGTYYATMRALDAERQLSNVAFDPATPAATPAALDWTSVPVARTVDTDYAVRVVIDRLCTDATTCVQDPPNSCSTQTVGIPCASLPPTHYRATIRVTGPRNTMSVTQATLTW